MTDHVGHTLPRNIEVRVPTPYARIFFGCAAEHLMEEAMKGRLKFQDKEWLGVWTDNGLGVAITTQEHYDARSLWTHAHLYPNCKVVKEGEVIGTIDDIEPLDPELKVHLDLMREDPSPLSAQEIVYEWDRQNTRS